MKKAARFRSAAIVSKKGRALASPFPRNGGSVPRHFLFHPQFLLFERSHQDRIGHWPTRLRLDPRLKTGVLG